MDYGSIVGGVGSLFTAFGQWSAGRAAKAQGELQRAGARIQADQMRDAAKRMIVAGQQQAQDELKQARLLQSRALVNAVAGGGAATDPTIVNIISGIAEEGSRRAGQQMMNARLDASQMRMQALGVEFGGQNAAAAGRTARAQHNLGASTTLLREGYSLYQRYGGAANQPRQTPVSQPAGDSALLMEFP